MQKLNFRSKDYNRILFASDFHWRHQKSFVWEARGFECHKAHSDFIENTVLELTDKDLLFHLGDFALNTTEEDVQRFLNDIKCETYLLAGNHPSGIKQSYQRAKTDFLERNNFYTTAEILPLSIAPNVVFMGDQFLVSIDGRKFFCNHFASKTWDGMQHGWGYLHGHSHGGLEGSQPDELNDGKILDCGVDNALKYNKTPFFSFQEVCKILDKKPIKLVDHHQ